MNDESNDLSEEIQTIPASADTVSLPEPDEYEHLPGAGEPADSGKLADEHGGYDLSADSCPETLPAGSAIDPVPMIPMTDEDLIKDAEAPPVSEAVTETDPDSDQTDDQINATREELKPVIECLLFVAEEPLSFKVICKVLGTVPEEEVQQSLDALIAEYDQRGSGLEIREVAGGWRISTRPQHHDFIRQYLKTRPSARLSLPALETLAVIAYKQPITVPEILEIRGVTSSSAIKTLLEKRLIVTKGRKETVGRPMMYGTSREFLIQFGLRDLTELPSIEDFEDLAQ